MFKEEEEAIKVDLHEGCGRTKLFWLMALADSKTMKAMVEFREHTGNVSLHLLLLYVVFVEIDQKSVHFLLFMDIPLWP